MSKDSPNFRDLVLDFVQQVPAGKVATYGQIAALAGSPRAGRIVGGILSSLGMEESHIPWWRIVNRHGYLSIKGHSADIKDFQRELLLRENVQVNDEYLVDLRQFGWQRLSQQYTP